MVQIHVHVRILGSSLWTLICLSLLNKGVGPKAMVPTITKYQDDKIRTNKYISIFILLNKYV